MNLDCACHALHETGYFDGEIEMVKAGPPFWEYRIIRHDPRCFEAERARLRPLLERCLTAVRTAGIDLDLAAELSRELGKEE